MPNEDLMNEFEEREEQVMEIQLIAAAKRTAITLDEYVKTRMLQGASTDLLRQELLADLNTGGRMFGEFKNAIKATAHGNMRRVADIGHYSEDGIEKDYKWVTTEKPNVCPDCRPRHGQIKTWAEWEALGLPRSGWSVCREHCWCNLTDVKVDVEPIKREKRK